MKLDGRALTDEQKREVLDRIYTAWAGDRMRAWRLGQLIANVCGTRSVFHVEDFDLVDLVEEWPGVEGE